MNIRPLTELERESVKRFYRALGQDDRRKRFCCTISDETIGKYVERLNFERDRVIAAFDEQNVMVGIAELVRGPKESEMAFSVRPDRRGQKIGTSLIEYLIELARTLGIAKVFVMFLSDNTPMRRMAQRAGMALSVADGEAYASRELGAQSAEDALSWASLPERPASNMTQARDDLVPAA